MAGNVLHTEHSTSVQAPADLVYDILADVSRWPLHFPPTIHAERTEGDSERERIRIWALANGVPRAWNSRRSLDKREHTIMFRQESSPPPLRFMEGSWRVTAADPGRTEVVLTHDFEMLTDDPADRSWVSSAVEDNSTTELRSLKRAAECPAEVRVEFADTLAIHGAAADAYRFIYECSEWPSRLPHVARLALTEDVPGIQVVEMDTIAADGHTSDVHTTKSVRVCFSPSRIVYKQTVLPPAMTAHSGEWLFTPAPGGVEVTSRHSALIDLPTARKMLPGASTADIRDRVKAALSSNSLATLRAVKAHLEWDGTRHRVRPVADN